MAHKNSLMFMSIIITLTLASTVKAVEYTITNTACSTPGGARFNTEIGEAFALKTLIAATKYTWQIFQQCNPADRKPVARISLIVEDIDGVAYVSNNEIHLSARYVGGYSGDLRREIAGVLYHEVVHVWQWNGNGQAPGGLIEGIADFVRLKAGFIPAHWVGPGGGDRWDQGYDVTARFLEYCDCLRKGFVAMLNRKMRTGYSDAFFVDLLGKTVDQLWADYKAMYGN